MRASITVCATMVLAGAAWAGGLAPVAGSAPTGVFEDRSAPSTYQYEQGGVTTLRWIDPSPIEVFVMQRFNAFGGADALETISLAWGNVPVGTQAKVYVWSNPSGDGDAANVILLHQQAVTVQSAGLGVNSYALTRAVPVKGVFFVGASITQRPTVDSPIVIAGQGGYVAGSSFTGYSSTTFNATSPASNTEPPVDLGSLGFSEFLVLRAGGSNTGFVYQGKLGAGGTNYTGSADLRLTMYDAPTGGNTLADTFEADGVNVAAGVFAVRVPASPITFVNAADPYLEVAVATPSGSGSFQTLAPRTRMGSVPSALSVPWAGISGVPASISAWGPTSSGIAYQNGRVGIRTSTPGAMLEVRGGGAGTLPFPQLRVNADSDAPYGAFLSLDASSTVGGMNWLLFSSGNAAGEGRGKLVFKNQTSAVYGPVFDAAGFVGIGNTAPGVPLDIVRAGDGNMLRLTSNSPDGSVFSLINSSSNGKNYSLLSTGSASNPGAFVIRDVFSSADRLTIFSSGRIGMGSTSNPTGMLDVTANSSTTVGVIGRAGPGPSGVGVYGSASGPGPKAAVFDGPVVVNGSLTVNGSLSKTSGSFRIPHPLDPDGKWLYHSFVESPDMMNVYNGIIVLDGQGRAVVELPDYFEALNSDYRYQLTAVGASMPGLYVSREIEKNRFEIAGGKAGAKVSWQVTGIRQDQAAKKSRIVPERERTSLDP